jgi:GWxTD domain-containing protein
LVAIFTALPHPLVAQAPAERAALARFRDSLRATADTGVLRRLERAQQALVKAHRADAMPLMRLGFVQLRRGEVLAERGRFSNAQDSFDRAAALQPDWPIAYAGRGLARLNVAVNEASIRHVVSAFINGDPIPDVASDFDRSGVVDPQYTEGLLQVSSIALRYRHPAQLRAALLALRQVAAQPVSRNFDVRLARVRIELATGLADSAAAVAATMLAANPDHPAGLIEAGRAALDRYDPRGAEAWYRGIALADTATARYYRADLVLVLPDSVLRQFDERTGDARAQVLRQFFEVHDPGSMTTASERLAEHYRRLDRARANFTILTDTYHADVTLPVYLTGREVDERGLVWVLHGPPTNRTYLNFTGGPKNESWQYQRLDGSEFLFHFVKIDDAVGYRRVASLMDILAMSKAAQSTGHANVKEKTANGEAIETYGAAWTAQVAQDILYSRENTSPTYAKMLSEGKNGAAALQAAERAIGDSSIAHGETSTLSYELPLDARVDIVAVGTDADGMTLQVVFAIPGWSLYAPPTGGPMVYPVRMRVRVARGPEVVVNIDTLRRFVARERIPTDGVLYGRLPIRVPPGEYQVFVALESPTSARGVVVPPQTVRIASATTPSIDLSDLAIGARSVRLPWRTARGDTAWVNPLHEFDGRDPMQLYFEVLGVPAGGAYKAALAIFKTGDARPQVQLGFSTSAAGSPDAVHREVDLGRLGAGSYQLQVTVSTPSGQTMVRRREFTVVR